LDERYGFLIKHCYRVLIWDVHSRNFKIIRNIRKGISSTGMCICAHLKVNIIEKSSDVLSRAGKEIGF
jgi:hypothetical protein